MQIIEEYWKTPAYACAVDAGAARPHFPDRTISLVRGNWAITGTVRWDNKLIKAETEPQFCASKLAIHWD